MDSNTVAYDDALYSVFCDMTRETNSVVIVDLNATITVKKFCKPKSRFSKITTGNIGNCKIW